jgi:hypothetical protein
MNRLSTLPGALVALSMLASPAPAAAARPGLEPLHERIAGDLKRGRPLLVTVHVALCDNRTIWCGNRGSGDGDQPRRNLYWGKAGLPAFLTPARGYRRLLRDDGDGHKILQRLVLRRRVRRVPAAWRRRGVDQPFDVLLVALAYRGARIADATSAFVRQVLRPRSATLRLPDGTLVDYGAGSHAVGYLGHNHLLDVPPYPFPRATRARPAAFFALACWSANYFARGLASERTHPLLLSRTRMYPGPFVVHGLLRGLAAGEDARRVYLRGVKQYARHQRTSERRIRGAFLYGGSPGYRRLLAGHE